MPDAGRNERRLGPYTLLEPVGRGGMADVHFARRDGASELCVLKQLKKSGDADQLFRLKREAHVLSHLAHPNIARLVDAGIDTDTFYLALELIPGQTVRHILRRLYEHQRRIPPEIAIQVAIEVLDGLEYAHDLRDAEGRPLELVHRDLSPNNVMISYEGRTKIIDFGIASGKLDDFRTMPGMILGTMRYISPEQALSKPVDRRSDIYTLGAVLYEMLTGAPVVQKGEHNAILDSVLRRRPEPFSAIAPELPAPLWPVVAKAIEKRAADRFDDAPSFRAALREASRGLRLPNSNELGTFVTHWFPDEAAAGTSRVLTPDADTFLDGEVSTTDQSDVSDTASESQPTLIDPDFVLPRGTLLPMLADPVATPAPPLVRPAPSMKMPLIALAAATLGTTLVLVWPEPPPPPPPPQRLVNIEPTVAPTVVSRPAAPEVDHAPREKLVKTAAAKPPAPAPEPQPESKAPRQSGLRALLARAQDAPDDLEALAQLHALILDEAKEVPAAKQAQIRAQVDAALRAGDVAGMERGLAMLESALNE